MSLTARNAVVFLLPLLLLAGASGCSRKPKPAIAPTPVPPPVTETTKPPETAKPPETPPESTALSGLQDVFFDYDKSDLRGESRDVLGADGELLTKNGAAKVLLEGHCDERGTVEYNLALGQRRADAVKNYLIQYGVDPFRLSTISYGEERPFVEGHDESAWSQNRRVHFVKQ
jgi:peptidoglycan-associated lipoprotein